jgi:hypothetical protein
MGSPEELALLERDLEATRGRLARDLDRLRSPETIANFKETLVAQATDAKDHLVGKAQEKLSAGIEDVWAEVKARAAANPAAALAIGAGIAWRIMQRPPIASTLVGVGLVSLLRTDPGKPAFGADLVARSVDHLGAAKQKASEWVSANQEGGLSDVANTMRTATRDVIQSTREVAGDAAERSASALKAVSDRSQQMFREGTRTVVDQASALSNPGEERDRALLGVAALAMAAAVAFAVQRRD